MSSKKKKTKLPDHIHKYKRIDISSNPDKPYEVLSCQAGGCNSYVPVKLAMGKLAECWICGDPFLLDKISITHRKPHCTNCIKKKIKPEIANLSELVKDI